MLEATLKDWQDLCRQAVVEHDPIRLLKLFLKIDRLQNHGILQPCRELSAPPASPQIPCPYCSALLEPQEQILEHNVFKCPWCEGRFQALDFSGKDTQDATSEILGRERRQAS